MLLLGAARRRLRCVEVGLLVDKRPYSTIKLPEPFLYHDGNSNRVSDEMPLIRTRPLALVLGWSNASVKSLSKYAQLYYKEGGCDSILLPSKPKMIYNPNHGRDVMQELNKVTVQTDCDLFISGFSVGAFLYSNMLMHLREENSLGESIEPRIRGLIFDSPVDWYGVPSGLSRSVVGSDGTLAQRSIEALIHAYLAIFKSVSQRYEQVSSFLHDHDFNIPSLWLFSDTDLVTKPDDIRKVIKKWQARGHAVTEVEFKGSPHVLHLKHFPDSYSSAISQFFQHQQQQRLSTTKDFVINTTSSSFTQNDNFIRLLLRNYLIFHNN